MYTSYTTAALTLRAKTSYSYTHVSLFNDRPETCNHCSSRCCCAPSSDLSIYTIPLHPKFIYGYCLRQSALIHCSPSRTFFSAGARYPCLPLRRHCTSGSYREVIGLLADIEGGEIGIKSVDEESQRSLRRENVRCRLRKGGVSLSYYPSGNLSLLSDFESKRDRHPKAARAYSSGWSRNRYEASEAEDFESETEEVEKYEDVGRDLGKRFDSRERRDGSRALSSRNVSEWEDRDRRERVESSASLDNKSREGYVQEEQRVNQQNSRDRSKKLTFRSEVRWDDVKRSSSLRDMESNSASVVKHLGKVDQRVVGSSDLSSTYTKLKDTSTTPSSYTKRVSDSRRHIESEIDERVVGSTDLSSSYTKLKDTSIISGNYTKRGSDSRRRIESEIDERVVGSTETSSSYTKLKETPTIPSSYTKRVSGSRSHIEDERLKDWVDTSTSLQYSVVGGDKRVQMEHEAVDISELNQHHENRTNVIRNHASNTVTDVMQGSSKTIVETRMGGQKHNSTSTGSLVQGASDRSEQRKQIDQHVSGHYTSKRALEKNTKLDELSKVEVERVSNSQKISDTRAERENYSTSSVNVVHGTTEKQSRTDSGVDHLFSSRRTSERDTRSSVISSSEVERVSNSFGRIETQKENSSRLFVRDKKDKQSTVVGVSLQASSGIADHSSSFSRTHIQALDDQTSRDEMEQSSYSRLESASRLDKSSALYIGEFADKLRQEIITADETDNPARNSSMLNTTESTKIEKHKEEGARQSSSRSGMKGPPVEMWDVRNPHADEPRPEEPEEDSLTMVAVDPSTSHPRTDNQITRRSHRSLWTYISDVIRAGWVLRSGSHNSTPKLGTKSSSNESVSSEAWFSGREPDENDDGTDMKGVDAATKESVQFESLVDPSNMRLHSAPSQASSEVSRQGNTETLSETSSSTSKSRTRRGSVSKASFHESESEELQGSEGGEGTLGIPFSATTIDQPSTPINFTISPTTDEGRLGIPFSSATIDLPSTPINFTVPPTTDDAIIDIGNDRARRSGFVELEIKEKPAGDKLPEAGRTVVEHGELKQRKLQKNKQVLRERFDEWEEAYNRESEQRKLDELFMREALLEAKKAADTWEVPVGAVLVQNGKIIARGCNLVEEARDSTAHAEMICIREASSLLRTWRLVETTLYVTLEPCAMCAGAILQARIDTLVWGAPNKLLGADGSWVRLFPGGDGGGNSSDTSIQMPGPVHPFHPKIVIRRGILATECSDIMQQFFQLRRRKKKTEPEQEAPSCLPIVHRTKLFAKMHDMFCIMFCL